MAAALPSTRHTEIARRLSQPIPAPPVPPPRPRAQWEGCRVSDQLAQPDGRTVEVTACDSEGLWVRSITPKKSALSQRLTTLEGWKKLRKKDRLPT